MRLIWFSNRPPSGTAASKKTIGTSWIESMEYELSKNPDIQLGIVYSQLAEKPKTIQSKNSSTQYFMVPRHPAGKFSRWVNRFFSRPFSKKPLQSYLKIIDDFKPDVVLFFGSETEFPLIIPELKMPSILWFQGNLTVYQKMYQSGIPLKKTFFNESLKSMVLGNTMIHNYRIFKRKAAREKKIFSTAKNFIGRSDWDHRLVSIMAPQANYYHCDEPMRPIFWQNEWKPWSNREKFVITTTISPNLYKGLETVFEAAMLLDPMLDKTLEWRIIGFGPEKTYVKTAQKHVKYSKTNPLVKIIGSKSAEDLVKELLDADLYVHPSHIENSPNSVQEAMLIGMPVIATNSGGTPSMLTDGKEGLLVQNKDPYALAGAILELYNDSEKAQRLGKNARERGMVRNDSKKIHEELLLIFERMIASAEI